MHATIPVPVSPALEAVELTKRYGRGTVALSDVTLSVPAGTITALVGPNAAGKSTLLKTWVAFERPTRGSVRVQGVDPWRDRRGALEHLAYVAQQPALYRGLSVEEHLDLAAHARRAFDRAVSVRHLADLDIPLRARTGILSGGQQAQVSLAIALGTRADVLILDEPLASLDPLARSEFIAAVRAAIAADGATAVLSSHIVSDIEQAADRLIVLGVGRLLVDASLDELRATHRAGIAGVGDAPGRTPVGRFADAYGATRALYRTAGPADPEDDGLEAASLDEIVKGYLAAGRQTNPGSRS